MEAAKRQKIPDLHQTKEKYFLDTYNVKLKHPGLPCLLLGPINKNIYIPMELCMMMAQPMLSHKVLYEDAVSKMIRTTAVSPTETQKRIMNELQRNNNIYKNDPYAKEFGINIAGSITQLTDKQGSRSSYPSNPG